MLFNQAIRVKGNEFNPLQDVPAEAIAPQLEISLDDLSRMHASIQEEARGLGFFVDGCYVTTNPSIRDVTESSPYGRTIYSNYSDYKTILKEDDRIVLAIKGSGFEHWLASGGPVRKYPIKYPILISKKPMYDTHRVWGGETKTIGIYQFLHGLILNILIQRHDLPQAAYKPFRLSGFQELPVEEDGNIRVISLEDYCDMSFRLAYESNGFGFSIPSLEEARNFAEFFYYGNMLHLRVPPRQHVQYCPSGMASRCPTAGSLSGILTREEVNREVEQFHEKLTSIVKVVHRYGGAFTSRPLNLSSLVCYNVTMDGVVCDLDTLSFFSDSEKETKILQDRDCSIMGNTIENFRGLF